ncbi:MAG: TRAP transporter substrate-binding protein [Pseudomonadota bacterium]
MGMVNRRKVLGAAAVGAAGLAVTACGQSAGDAAPGAPSIAVRRRRLNMVTTWPKNLPGLGKAAERVAEYIGQLSDGQIEVKVFAAGELVPAFEAFDAVADGSADLYHGAEYYWKAKSEGYPFFTAVPMGMTAQEIMGWIDFGGGQALWDELAGQFGVKPLQAANTGHQMGGWFKTEINSLDDFSGLKMRIPGQGGDMVRALGGAAVALSGGEIYQGLQTGQIDATEWVGPWNDFYLGFHREAPFYYGPGFHEPGASLAVGINRGVWDDLTPTEQAIIQQACQSVNHLSLGEFTYENARHLDILVQEHGTQLRNFPEDVVRAMGEAALDIRSDAGNSGAIESRIYESFETAIKSMRGWAKVSDGTYYNARELASQ